MKPNQRFIIYTGDETHYPLEQYSSCHWKRIQDWLIERGYSGEFKMATLTREKRGVWYAIVRVLYYPSAPPRYVVIAQSKQWQYNHNPYRRATVWEKVN